MLYWIIQPGSNVGGIGAGLVRMVRSWHEWLIVWGYDISQPPPDVDAEKATEIVRNLLGMPGLDVEITGTGLWGNNEARGDRRAQGQHRARESEARGPGGRDGLRDYEFNAHGVDLGQFYESPAIVRDGPQRPQPTRDPELYYQPSTVPGVTQILSR